MNRVYKYPKLILIVITIITVFFAFNLTKVKIDNDTMKFLSEDNPARLAIDLDKEIFGPSLTMSVGIESIRGSIFSVEAINIIEELTDEIEILDEVDNVKSLTNSDYIDGIDGSLVVSKLVENFEGTPEEVKDLKRKLLDWDIYSDLLISNDFTASQIVVTLKGDITPDEQELLYEKLKNITENIDSNQFNFYLAGLPSMIVLLSKNMMSDLKFLIPIVILILLIALYLSFKRFSGVFLPIITVVISTIWTIGLMGFVGVPLSILGIIIPVLMMAVGSAYGIHVISHYYDDLRSFSGDLTLEKHNSIILNSLMYVKKPIFLAGLTTVAGFASLSISSIIPMRDFGIFTSIGIVFALVVALTLIPALLSFNYKSALKGRVLVDKNKKSLVERGLDLYYDSFGFRKYLIIFLALIITIFSFVGLDRLIIDNSIVEYFKESTHIRVSDRFLRDKFAGTTTFDLVVTGDGAGIDPKLLKAMDNLSNYLTTEFPEISKVLSFTDTVKRMNQVMHVPFVGDFLGFDDSFDDFGSEDDSSDFESFFSDDSFYEDTAADSVMTVSDPEKSEDFMTSLTNAYALADNPMISANDLINLLKKETNYKGYGFYEIPYDPGKYGHSDFTGLSNLLSQYYSMTGKLEGFTGIDDDSLSPSNIKMTIMINTKGNLFVKKIIPIIEAYTKNYFPPEYTVLLAGTALAQESTTNLIVSSAVNSIILSLIMVFIILSVAYKSLIAGLFGMIPLGFTVLFNYGLMGFWGIKLDMSTAMVGSIAIGIGIDYTIHFMASYHRYSTIDNCGNTVTKKALLSSGKAIIFNALSVAAGFSVLIKSNFNPLMYLGILISITMLVASMASLTIMPGLFNIFKPKFICQN